MNLTPNEGEIFTPGKENNLYLISNQGRVGSKIRNKFLSLKPCSKGGYCRCWICDKGKKEMGYIHRLVAETYIPNPDNLPEVNHKDEDKTNNRVENLEWISVKDNRNGGTRNARIQETKRKSKQKVSVSSENAEI